MIDYRNILTIVKVMKEKLKELNKVAKEKPIIVSGVIGLILLCCFMIPGGKSAEVDLLEESTVPFDEEKKDIVGVKESIDPRDAWTARLQQKVEDTKDQFSSKLEEKADESEKELRRVREEIEALRLQLLEQQKIIELQKSEAPSAGNITSSSAYVNRAATRTLGLFSKDYGSKKRNIKDYIPSGTFARAVMMTGVVVGTGTNSQSNPEPIRLRLTDVGILSKNLRVDQIKEAILIGDCSGDLSNERAKCRLQKMSLENKKGEIIERQVEGWIIGEDGRNGVRGMVVDKSSDLIRMAMVSGLLNGFSQFLQNQSTKGVFPISPITGQQNSLNAASALKGGVAGGTGDAFSKLADFAIERFNSLSPQIVIASGREVDVFFGSGVDLNGALEEVKIRQSENNGVNAEAAPENSREGYEAFNEALQQMNAAKTNREAQDGF